MSFQIVYHAIPMGNRIKMASSRKQVFTAFDFDFDGWTAFQHAGLKF